MKLIAYLAHPVSAPDLAGIEANLHNARGWLRWLVDNTSWAISAPWVPYVESLAEDHYRDRGLEDDLAMLGRGHDIIVLTGGRISSGMEMERVRAMECGLPVLDLTRMGRSAPLPAVYGHAGTLEAARHNALIATCCDADESLRAARVAVEETRL